MPNPLFNALVGGRMSGNGPLNMLQQFQKFKQDMQGKNPKEEVSRLLQSGKINQQQLNQIPFSYTHLDVYKRQGYISAECGNAAVCVF